MSNNQGTSVPPFSELVVYADESGTASLKGIDANYPIFVLAFVVMEKRHYVQDVVPSLQQMKFDFFGHDQVVFHEREMRREEGEFAFLQISKEIRTTFMNGLNKVVEGTDATVVAAVIDKEKHAKKYTNPWDCYQVALHFCMEKLAGMITERASVPWTQHVVFESRGSAEDKALELEFRRIAEGQARWGYKKTDFTCAEWKPVFASKQTNSAGLQLADLFARPIGLNYLHPEQSNRAFDIIEPMIPFPGYKVFPTPT